MQRPAAIRVVLNPLAQPAGEDGSGYAQGGIVSQSVIRNQYSLQPPAARALVKLVQNRMVSADEVRDALGLASSPCTIALDAAGGGTVTLRNGETLQIVSGALSITLD